MNDENTGPNVMKVTTETVTTRSIELPHGMNNDALTALVSQQLAAGKQAQLPVPTPTPEEEAEPDTEAVYEEVSTSGNLIVAMFMVAFAGGASTLTLLMSDTYHDWLDDNSGIIPFVVFLHILLLLAGTSCGLWGVIQLENTKLIKIKKPDGKEMPKTRPIRVIAKD